jgi:hypothetical protein
LITRKWKEEARRKYLERQDERQKRLEAEELKRAKKGQKDTAQVAKALVRRPDNNV